MKPINLIVFPLAIFIVVSIIFNNAFAWQQTYGIDLTQDVPFQIFSSSSPLLLIFTGRFDQLWSMLISPTIGWGTLWGLVTFIIDIVVGAFLLIMSLGISVGGSLTALSVGGSFDFGASNPQGTKLIQMLGVGLLIWGIASGALGGWQTYFDAVAVGLGTVFSLIMQFIFIIGLVWQSQSQY